MFSFKIFLILFLLNVSWAKAFDTGDPQTKGLPFTRRDTTSLPIFPFSYAEILVTCEENEVAISGGYKFSTYGLKLVESYPDGRNWLFKIYNDEDITSESNIFYAICSRFISPLK